MCKLFAHPGGVLDFQDSGGGTFWGFESPVVAMLWDNGTSEIECSASWIYIMYTFLTLL